MKKRDERNDEAGSTGGGLQGGGYGGLQGAGGAGRDLGDGSGELQGGSYGRGWGDDASIRSGRPARNTTDDSTEERQQMLRPPQEVDEDGRETSITDEGRSPDRGELGRSEDA